MRKKNKKKYFIAIMFFIFIFIYGFIKISISKPELVRKKSPFTVDVTLKPIDIRVETKDYIIYVNNSVIDDLKEKCNNVYKNIFLK